jgi:hypothetical protein
MLCQPQERLMSQPQEWLMRTLEEWQLQEWLHTRQQVLQQSE